jgi:hypothetical protein
MKSQQKASSNGALAREAGIIILQFRSLMPSATTAKFIAKNQN